MARTTFIEFNGKRIARLDFAGIAEEPEALAAILEAGTIIQQQPPKSLYTRSSRAHASTAPCSPP